jgi:hypothetical protein
MTMRNADHNRDKSYNTEQLKEAVLQMLPDKAKGLLFIEMLIKDKPRYFRDNLLLLKKHLPEFDPDIIKEAINFCLENSVYNTYRFVEVAKYYLHENTQKDKAKAVISDVQIKQGSDILNIKPGYSQLSTYETIL